MRYREGILSLVGVLALAGVLASCAAGPGPAPIAAQEPRPIPRSEHYGKGDLAVKVPGDLPALRIVGVPQALDGVRLWCEVGDLAGFEIGQRRPMKLRGRTVTAQVLRRQQGLAQVQLEGLQWPYSQELAVYLPYKVERIIAMPRGIDGAEPWTRNLRNGSAEFEHIPAGTWELLAECAEWPKPVWLGFVDVKVGDEVRVRASGLPARSTWRRPPDPHSIPRGERIVSMLTSPSREVLRNAVQAPRPELVAAGTAQHERIQRTTKGDLSVRVTHGLPTVPVLEWHQSERVDQRSELQLWCWVGDLEGFTPGLPAPFKVPGMLREPTVVRVDGEAVLLAGAMRSRLFRPPPALRMPYRVLAIRAQRQGRFQDSALEAPVHGIFAEFEGLEAGTWHLSGVCAELKVPVALGYVDVLPGEESVVHAEGEREAPAWEKRLPEPQLTLPRDSLGLFVNGETGQFADPSLAARRQVIQRPRPRP